jgi:hypothetical protein
MQPARTTDDRAGTRTRPIKEASKIKVGRNGDENTLNATLVQSSLLDPCPVHMYSRCSILRNIGRHNRGKSRSTMLENIVLQRSLPASSVYDL